MIADLLSSLLNWLGTVPLSVYAGVWVLVMAAGALRIVLMGAR